MAARHEQVGEGALCLTAGRGAQLHDGQLERRADELHLPVASSYTVTGADVGHTFTCILTASNPGGSASSTSNEVIAA
jgi:hypothetical protein